MTHPRELSHTPKAILESLTAYRRFWSKNPALFIGLNLLLGTACAFHSHPIFAVLFLFLSVTAKSKRTFIIALLCIVGTYFYASYRHPKITLPQEKMKGTGVFHIDQIKNYASPFARSYLYKGTLKKFETDGITLEEIPCNIYLPLFGKRPLGNTDYKIRGTLCQKGDFDFVLKPEKKEPWKPTASLFNLSEWRFCAKQATSRYLKKHITDPHAHTLLNALATGEINERIISMEFGKVGLQHILAISGFHFAIAALFLNFIFRLLFSDKLSALLLIFSLSAYYLFLGNAPSIQRAYLAIILFVVGKQFSLKISGLNALGAALIIELLISPICAIQLGFQLTFLCTFAILLFYPLMNRALLPLFPKRTYSQMRSMSLLDKHGALLSSILRQSLAINFAVHLISLPVLLFLFHKFPLLSLSYNLFFPTFILISMLLLYAALLFAPLVPFLSHAIHSLNNAWTSSILQLTTNPPAFLNFSIRTQNLNLLFVISFLAAAFFLGILFYEKEQRKNQST